MTGTNNDKVGDKYAFVYYVEFVWVIDCAEEVLKRICLCCTINDAVDYN